MTWKQALFVAILTVLAVGVAAFAYAFITAAFQFMEALAILGAFFADLILIGAAHA